MHQQVQQHHLGVQNQTVASLFRNTLLPPSSHGLPFLQHLPPQLSCFTTSTPSSCCCLSDHLQIPRPGQGTTTLPPPPLESLQTPTSSAPIPSARFSFQAAPPSQTQFKRCVQKATCKVRVPGPAQGWKREDCNEIPKPAQTRRGAGSLQKKAANCQTVTFLGG